MIRVNITQDEHYEGGTTISVSGHANTQVCAAVSALVQSLIAALYAIERRYGSQITVNGLRAKRGKRK